ncbi:MAG: hypothetical protein IT480_17235 [Gammaproteobacteria bacterium]|nr:hypothetical protein [Gammaproteobacteria bacterium]
MSPGPGAPAFERVGMVVTGTGAADRHSYSKLAPWPMTDGNRLYSGCYDPAPLLADQPGQDRCFTTIDLAQPDKPVRLATVMTFDPGSSPPPPAGHIIWRADYRFPALRAQIPCRVNWNDADIAAGRTPAPCWDPGWNTHSHFVARGPGSLLAANQERYRGGTNRQASFHGVKFYDVSDPAHPKYLSYWEAPASAADPRTGEFADMGGTHHFNFQGNYLFLGTTYRGFVGKILVILDVSDPLHPREVSHWWLPGQRTPEEDALRSWQQSPDFSLPVVRLPGGLWRKHVGMHYVTIDGDRAYLSYHQAGLVILDVADKSHPKLLSQTDYLVPGAERDAPDAAQCFAAAGGQPAACGNAHSAKIVPGRDGLLIMTDEYFTCPYGHMRIFDVSEPARPALLSHFLLPETIACSASEPRRPADAARYPRRGPSTHMGNAAGPNLFFVAWYGAGVRAIDITDPARPFELGRYTYRISDDYPDAEGLRGQDTYDVVFGPGGRLYVSDGTAGLRVLRYRGPAATTPGLR